MLIEMLMLIAIVLQPAALVVWFIISLVNFLKTPREDAEARRRRRLIFIIAAVLLGLVIAALGTLMIVFALSIRHM